MLGPIRHSNGYAASIIAYMLSEWEIAFKSFFIQLFWGILSKYTSMHFIPEYVMLYVCVCEVPDEHEWRIESPVDARRNGECITVCSIVGVRIRPGLLECFSTFNFEYEFLLWALALLSIMFRNVLLKNFFFSTLLVMLLLPLSMYNW